MNYWYIGIMVIMAINLAVVVGVAFFLESRRKQDEANYNSYLEALKNTVPFPNKPIVAKDINSGQKPD